MWYRECTIGVRIIWNEKYVLMNLWKCKLYLWSNSSQRVIFLDVCIFLLSKKSMERNVEKNLIMDNIHKIFFQRDLILFPFVTEE